MNSTMATGGKPIYGETVGILVLDTDFPRIHGDVGNARTFDFPVRYQVVRGATVDNIVADKDKALQLLPAFIEAARQLEKDGVRAITTTCGFLTVVQKELAAAVSVPVVTSSLFLIPLVRSMVGGRPIGVVTAHAGHLSDAHLRAAGVQADWDVHVSGMENSPCFSSAILGMDSGGLPQLDVGGVSDEVARVCMDLVAKQPELAAIVFECTNLQPYAMAAQAKTGRPIFGIFHLVEMLSSATRAPRFDGEI